MAITKKIVTGVEKGYGEIGTLVHCWWIQKNGAAAMENTLVVPQKVKHKVTVCPSNSTSRNITKRNEHTYMYVCVCV